MQETYKFVKFLEGTSKKTEKPYTIIELSDGISPFTIDGTDEVKQWFRDNADDLERGSEVTLTLEPTVTFRGIGVTCVDVDFA